MKTIFWMKAKPEKKAIFYKVGDCAAMFYSLNRKGEIFLLRKMIDDICDYVEIKLHTRIIYYKEALEVWRSHMHTLKNFAGKEDPVAVTARVRELVKNTTFRVFPESELAENQIKGAVYRSLVLADQELPAFRFLQKEEERQMQLEFVM